MQFAYLEFVVHWVGDVFGKLETWRVEHGW